MRNQLIQLYLPEMVAHYKEIAEALARRKNHRLGKWKQDNGKYFGYGYYAECVHKHCTAFGWVTDRKSINSIRGAIYLTQVCPLRKRKKSNKVTREPQIALCISRIKSRGTKLSSVPL